MLGQLFGLAFVMKAIPTAKYVVGRGPEFNMAHRCALRSASNALPVQMK